MYLYILTNKVFVNVLIITHVCNQLLFYKYILLAFTCYVYEVTIGLYIFVQKLRLEVCFLACILLVHVSHINLDILCTFVYL